MPLGKLWPNRRGATRARGVITSELGQNRISSLRGYVFRFAPESGHRAMRSACPFRATTGLMHRSNYQYYSITSSAWTSRSGGMVIPSAFPVLRLINNSNLVGCSIGKSAGLAPRAIRSTYSAARRCIAEMLGP